MDYHTSIKRGQGRLHVSFFKKAQRSHFELMEEGFRVNGATEIRITTGFDIHPRLSKGLWKRWLKGEDILDYKIELGLQHQS